MSKVVIEISEADAQAALDSQAFQGAGGIASAIPGLSAQQVINAFLVAKLPGQLAANGVQAKVTEVPDSPGEYYASRALVGGVSFVAGAVAGALLKG